MKKGERQIAAESAEPLVLVPNRTYQQLAFAERVPDGGRPLRAPAVEVFSLWAEALYTRAAMLRGETCPHTPRRLRLRRLWEDAISATDQRGLFQADVTSLALESMEADRLCEHWLLPVAKHPGEAWHDEGFCRWRDRVHASLVAHDWIDGPGLLRRLAELLESAETLPVTLPGVIQLHGFIEITPLEHRVLNALSARGVELRFPRSAAKATPSVAIELFPTVEEELWAAANWARQQLEAGATRLAVLVNEFQSLRPALDRVFRQSFSPQAALLAEDDAEPPYYLHGGQPLADQPLVRDAFDLLELSLQGPRAAHPFERISRWLLSSAWLGADTEAPARALLELALRDAGRFEPSLVFTADRAVPLECPILVERVARLPKREADESAASLFHRLLSHWGWPGPAATGSSARQVVDGFRGALEALAFSGEASPSQGLAELRQLCRERSLSAPGGVLAPVQIMAVEDAVTQNFEQLRLLNVHGDNWPGPVRLNRLLPFQLASNLPRSDMRRQLEYTRALQDGVLAGAGSAVISRALMIDGVETAPSPLLAGLENPDQAIPVPANDLASACWPGAGTAEARLERDRLETVARLAGPALPPEEQPVKGVVSLLNLQSACPWAAFLVHRLGAKFPDQPSPFADLLFTGNLVHAALERLYRRHVGGESSPRAAEIPGVVDQVLQQPAVAFRLAPAALSAERRRLAELLGEWLAAEKSLPVGRPVALEEQREATLAGLRFSVRMDRIDALADGTLVLDYKTGRLNGVTWGDRHPVELQLPLYAVLSRQSGEPVQGIGLLSIRSGEMKPLIWSGSDALKGRGVDRVGQSKKIPFDSWEAAVDAWEKTVTELLEAYRAGHADFIVHQDRPLQWAGLELLLRPLRPRPAFRPELVQ